MSAVGVVLFLVGVVLAGIGWGNLLWWLNQCDAPRCRRLAEFSDGRQQFCEDHVHQFRADARGRGV